MLQMLQYYFGNRVFHWYIFKLSNTRVIGAFALPFRGFDVGGRGGLTATEATRWNPEATGLNTSVLFGQNCHVKGWNFFDDIFQVHHPKFLMIGWFFDSMLEVHHPKISYACNSHSH